MTQTIRQRPTGAKASLGRTGFPHVESRTGGTLDIKTGASEVGFNPLDLLYASLSACLAMSARMAASRLGVLDAIRHIEADVTGEKAEEGLSRVAMFNLDIRIEGDLPPETKAEIIRLAEEEICTVSNTLQSSPQFRLVSHP